MKAAYFMEHGGPEVIQYGDLPDPVAGRNDVLVDVHAASVNGADWTVVNAPSGARCFRLSNAGALLDDPGISASERARLSALFSVNLRKELEKVERGLSEQDRQLLVEAGQQQRRQPLTLLAYVAANCHAALARSR